MREISVMDRVGGETCTGEVRHAADPEKVCGGVRNNTELTIGYGEV